MHQHTTDGHPRFSLRRVASFTGLLALTACDAAAPVAPLSPSAPRAAITYDTASLTRAGYLFETAFTVPISPGSAAVAWVSTGITLNEGDRAFLIPDGSVAYRLTDEWANWCDTNPASQWPWWCNIKSGSAGPYGGISGPSGNTNDDLRLFYRIDRPGTSGQILANPAVDLGPGVIQVSRAGADNDVWTFSGQQQVFIWVKRAPGLALSCTPGVQRGGILACTATPIGGQITEAIWTFTDSEGHEVAGPTGAVTAWGGTIVIGGTVRLRAKVAGVSFDITNTVAVTPRAWGPLTLQVSTIGHDNLPYPPTSPSQLANTDIVLPAVHGAHRISQGPNTGWWYLPAPPTVPVVQRWSNAWQPTDPWYQLQTGGPHPGGSGNWCSPADMPGIEQSAREHEGMSVGSGASHLSVMRDYFASFPQAANVDPLTPQGKLEGFRVYGTPTADPDFSTLFEVAVRSSALADPRQAHYDPTIGPSGPAAVPAAVFPCYLRF